MSLSPPPWDASLVDTATGRLNRLMIDWLIELVNLIPSGSLADLTSVQTFSNKTLLLPIIASLINATHNHENAAGGGVLGVDAVSIFASGYAGTFQIVSNMRDNVGVHEYKTRNLTFTNGVLTTLGAESAWTVLS